MIFFLVLLDLFNATNALITFIPEYRIVYVRWMTCYERLKKTGRFTILLSIKVILLKRHFNRKLFLAWLYFIWFRTENSSFFLSWLLLFNAFFFDDAIPSFSMALILKLCNTFFVWWLHFLPWWNNFHWAPSRFDQKCFSKHRSVIACYSIWRNIFDRIWMKFWKIKILAPKFRVITI